MNNDKELALWCLFIFALIVSVVIIMFRPDLWEGWKSILSAIIGIIGGIITGQEFKKKIE